MPKKGFLMITKALNRITEYGIRVIFLLSISFYFFVQILYAFKGNALAYAAGALSLCLLLFFAYLFFRKFFAERPLGGALLVVGISLCVYIGWAFYSKSQPTNDYKVLIDGARAMLDGSFGELSHDKENYFYFYNFQTGYVIYLAAVLKLSGGSLIGLKVAEIIILTLSNLVLYLILKKFVSTEISILCSLSYCLLLFNVEGSSIINNQHLSTLTVLCGVYFLINKKFKGSKCLAGAFLALSYIFRQSCVIFLIAVFCLYIVKIIRSGFKTIKNDIIELALTALSYFAVLFLFDFSVRALDIVPLSALSGNLKYFKFVLGIQDVGITGSKNESALKTHVYFDLAHYGFDYDLYNSESKRYILNCYFNDTYNTLRYICKKLVSFVGGTDNQYYFIGNQVSGKVISGMCFIGNCQYYALTFLTFVGGIILSVKKKISSESENLLMFSRIAFIGFFLVHIFIEAQTRYRFDQYWLLSVIAATQLHCIIEMRGVGKKRRLKTKKREG